MDTPASTGEKQATFAKNNVNLLFLLFICSVFDPSAQSSMCSFAVVMWDYMEQLANDPPGGQFLSVSLPPPTRRIASPLRALCPRACPRADGAARAYVTQEAALEGALGGIATAGNRYSSAKAASSASGMLLQTAVGKAFAGEVAAAIPVLNTRAAALGAALSAAGHEVALASPTIDGYRRNGLPSAVLARLVKLGFTQADVDGALAAAPVGGVTFARLLSSSLSPGPFAAANHTITTGGVGAIIDALARQRAISSKTHTLLAADLAAVARGTAKPRAHLRGDASHVRGTAGALLHFAVLGLT